jgi:hypothetical protein
MKKRRIEKYEGVNSLKCRIGRRGELGPAYRSVSGPGM